MPISSSAGTTMTCSEECIIPAARASRQDQLGGRCEACPLIASGKRNALYFYPWLIERISQTFFREWIGAHCVPTKIDHAEWLCTMCGEYTATWETRSGSYCRYCWSLGRTSPVGSVPVYLKELIPHVEV
jgi:hypothetical protein